MGRYNLSPHRIHAHATSLLRTPSNQHHFPPPWYIPLSQTPPPQPLVRPLFRRRQAPGAKSSKMFKPVKITYTEDQLRWEYFNDHPWELARPRIVLEEDGRDGERWDWSVELDFALNRPRAGSRRPDRFGRTTEQWDEIYKHQAGRPLNGEAVIKRQSHLLQTTNLPPTTAYDKARKELYRARHSQEIERRIAREEALATGAFFGLGPLEIGMRLEDAAFEDWRAWAVKETVALRQVQGAAYTGEEGEGSARVEGLDEGEKEELQVREVEEAVPGSRRGQEALGGEGVHP